MGSILAYSASLPAGGGAFQLPDLTIGLFRNDQPDHRLSLGSDRSQDVPLSADQGWLLPAGSEGLCQYDQPLELVTVSLSSQILVEVGLNDPAAIAPQIGELDPLLTQMALNAQAAGAGGTLYRETMHRALAAHLAQIVAPPPSEVAAMDDSRLARTVAFIQDHLSQDLTLDGMAEQAGMSPFHFSKAFKAATGQSPLQYVISARIDLAKVLLKTTDLAVAEIAYRTGYGDLSRFGQHFKKRVGATPKAFRNS